VITFPQNNKNIEKGVSFFKKGEAEISPLKLGIISHLRPLVIHTPGRTMYVRFKSRMNVACSHWDFAIPQVHFNSYGAAFQTTFENQILLLGAIYKALKEAQFLVHIAVAKTWNCSHLKKTQKIFP